MLIDHNTAWKKIHSFFKNINIDIDEKYKNIFIQAFTHKTYENESEVKGNYEMLEFVGDALLQSISARYCVEVLELKDPGEASKLRAKLVSTHKLSKISKKLNLQELLLFSPGAPHLTENNKVLADIFESMIAALYYAQGESAIIDFCYEYLFVEVEDIMNNDLRDPKTIFQEIVQAYSRNKPFYKSYFTEQSGLWNTDLMFEDQIYGTGSGANKKISERAAARDALNKHFSK